MLPQQQLTEARVLLRFEKKLQFTAACSPQSYKQKQRKQKPSDGQDS